MGNDKEEGMKHGGPPKVLVVDDEEWMRDACEQILQAEGCEVMTAIDGPTGLLMVKRHMPDLILADLKMPGMNGIECLESVKAFDADIVAIVITGFATLGAAVEAMKAGAYDFLPKPFKPAELRDVVRRGIEHRSAALKASALLRGEAPPAELHLAMLAHRFKAPLATMRQCLWVILQGYAGDMSSRAKGMIEIVAQRADEMMRFVDDWLRLSCLEQGKGISETKEVDVAEIVTAVVDRTKQDPWAEKLTIHSEVMHAPGLIRADPKALDELFANLLDNAVRYTPAGGTITVEVEAAAEGVEVTVRDTGPGIGAEDIERIFEPFYRGQAQKKIPGTGLGLPIVRRITEGHGGKIAVETTLGKGSAFRVFLPRLPEPERFRQAGGASRKGDLM